MEPVLPSSVPVQRIQANMHPLPGSGFHQDFITPMSDPTENHDGTALRLPPLIGHRFTNALVSHWRLDASIAGQPASYGFLCALLFLRDVTFTGSSIDVLSGGLVDVSPAERNIPADIWDSYRTGFLATSPKDAKHWLTQHENHVCSHMRHFCQQSEIPTAILPGHFLFERIPEPYFDHFRQGTGVRTWTATNVPRHNTSMHLHFCIFYHIITLPSSYSHREESLSAMQCN
jgi:hypothetical protein